MQKFSFRLLVLLILCLFQSNVFSQQQKDYSVLLKSGSFIPEQNVQAFLEDSVGVKNNSFNGTLFLAVQFWELPSDEEKKSMVTAGIEIIDYMPNYVFTAIFHNKLDEEQIKQFNIRSLFVLTAQQKLSEELFRSEIPAHALVSQDMVLVNMISYTKFSKIDIQESLQLIGATVISETPMFKSFIVQIPISKIKQVATLPFVQWMEPIDEPNQLENLPGRTLHRVNILNDGFRNLKGSGIHVGVWDGGAISRHLDFLPASRLIQVQAGADIFHATHVAGTIAGAGLIDPKARGMAPKAKVYGYDYNGDIAVEMAQGIPANNLIVSNHSYGGSQTCGLDGSGVQYSTRSRSTDINMNNFPYHLHIHSAGNSQSGCTGGWSTITSSGKSAKNNIVVADITSFEVLANSSSCGPVHDGRIKPEISAMGTNVYSTYTPLNTYNSISGTSMATPGVAGTVALLVERYKQLNNNVLPPSSLIKNTVCNTAADLGNIGPDYRYGFGRINALGAVKILELQQYLVQSISQSAFRDTSITIPSGTARLKVMLTWNDPAATANINQALVNDLDLTVESGANIFFPWILDKFNPGASATKGADHYGNIEQVTIDNPLPGNYTIRINGTSVPKGPQEYALTWTVDKPFLEVTYPNAGESFTPGIVETITWNSMGISALQKVEYSLDSGVNWTVISSSVPAFTTRLNWTVPANANTSKALIRVSSGAIEDKSDSTFRILGTVTNLNTVANTCGIGQLYFTWSLLPSATHYDLYFLDTATANWEILANNITGNNYLASGLTPNASMWFSIVAKNNNTGAVGMRSVAINRIAPSTGLSPIGTISGPLSFCGVASNVVYSIPVVTGATSYQWNLPPGAVLVSGQGTNSITVDFPLGSSGGSLNVIALSGTCQTAPSTLTILFGGLNIPAPVSGGNQSVVYCGNGTLPVLTATATVQTGNNLIWYDAPTGGQVVSNPELNNLGTVTYYAASYDLNLSCESVIRTPVVLTISQATTAQITTSSSTEFCKGDSILLTATSGLSYSWNTGATTQSVWVFESGSYTVSVNYGNGCFSQTLPTSVVVNELPMAQITPAGPLLLCDGSAISLSANSSQAYLWSTGETTQSIAANQSGIYFVTLTDNNGCSAKSNLVSVTIRVAPVVTITASPYQKLHPGLSTTLLAEVQPSANYSYQWLKDGFALANETTAQLQVSFGGLGLADYSVHVTDMDGCVGKSSVLTISDSSSNRLFVYPNPSTGQFIVSYYTSINTQLALTIYDSKGARVYSKPYTVSSGYQQVPIDLRKSGKGIYNLVLHDSKFKKIATAKVVVL